MPPVAVPASLSLRGEPETSASVAEAHAPAVSEATPEEMPAVDEEPAGAAPAEVAPEAETEPMSLPGELVTPVPVPVKIPQPVVTGSAATGQFIQLP